MKLKSLLSNPNAVLVSVLFAAVLFAVGLSPSVVGAAAVLPEFDSILGKSEAINSSGKFDLPQAVVVSPDGSKLYVADTGNSTIQIFKTSDNSYLGKIGGPGSGNGQFAAPSDLVFNNDGSKLYVADTGNSRVQIFNGSNNAYLGQFGSRSCSSDGPVTDGNFCYPTALAVDSADNILVGDNTNYRVQKFDTSNNFILKFGTKGNESSVTPPGTLYDIQGLATDSSDSIYVVNRTNHQVAKFSSTGAYIQDVGSWGGGDNQLRYPTDITIDGSDTIFIMDVRPGNNNARVKKFNTSGVGVPPAIGQYGTGDGEFKDPQGIAISPDNSKLYVADTYNNRIQVFNTADDSFITKFGSGSQESGGMLNPYQTALSKDNKKIYVADSGNNRIQIYNTKDNSFVSQFGTVGTGNSEFKTPYGISVSPDGSKLYVIETGNHRIQIFNTSDNSYVGQVGGLGSGNGQFKTPYAVDFSADGSKYYVLDIQNNRIQIFNSADNSYAGQFGSGGTGNGQFALPRALMVSGNRLYVADSGNNRIQIFDTTDNSYVTQFGSVGASDGLFQEPRGLSLSHEGSLLYVADKTNSRIQIFNTNDNSYAGQFGSFGYKNGDFNIPVSISITSDSSKFYVTDQGNNRVQVFSYANVDTDGDGVVSGIEDAAPNNGDGNNDGIKDSNQGNITSFVNTETGKYITLVAPSGSVISTVGTAAATVEDEGKSYPFGLLSFTVEGVPVGEVADLEAYFFTDNSKDGYSARKFHSLSQEYSDVEGAVIAEVDVGASKALKLTYSIQDGGEGDEDGEANGTIVDPVGLSINSSPTVATSPIETSSTQADILAKTGDSQMIMLVIAVGLTALGLSGILRKRKASTSL